MRQKNKIKQNLSCVIVPGLLPLKRILNQGEYELRIDLEDFNGETRYAKYDAFDIGDFTKNYKLKVTGYTGTASK